MATESEFSVQVASNMRSNSVWTNNTNMAYEKEDEDGNAAMSSSGCPCMFSGCTFLWENGYTTKPNDSLHSGWNTVVVTHTDGCIVTD